MKVPPLSAISWLALFSLVVSDAAETANWEIPLGGNAYLTESAEGTPDRIEPGGVRQWRNAGSVFSIWFRADRAAALNLVLRLKAPEAGSQIRVACGERVFEKTINAQGEQELPLGAVEVKAAGYVRVDLRGIRKQGAVFADVSDLLVASQTPGLELDYVKDNKRDSFYWGRRGPSVHLPYEVPAGKAIEWFYSEVTVPEGQDPIGSYFMANGFAEGYFGIQVNGEKERRVLFSVWSPFTTDNPKDIPDDQRVKLLAKGGNVHGGEFGGEGSGGQSYLEYPWKAGTTYGFLNRARPDGKGNTIYTAWFHAPETGKWQLIASFLRPKTDKHLTGLHSFLENFSDRNGYQGRGALHGNQWVRDTDGEWTELTKSGFTGDAIAKSRFRRDYAGGAMKDKFFIRNGGFFPDTVELGNRFGRESTELPEIDLKALDASE
jgi:Domain of unknown function (DUF3472)/Domain of unknown function (DUF5077)